MLDCYKSPIYLYHLFLFHLINVFLYPIINKIRVFHRENAVIENAYCKYLYMQCYELWYVLSN